MERPPLRSSLQKPPKRFLRLRAAVEQGEGAKWYPKVYQGWDLVWEGTEGFDSDVEAFKVASNATGDPSLLYAEEPL